MFCGGLAAAEPPRDLESLAAAERERAAAHREAGTEETRWAWIEALARVAWAEAEAGVHAAAAERYRTAVAALPGDAEAVEAEFVAMLHDGLGRALQNTGEFDAAENHLAEALRIRAAQAGGETSLGVSEGHLGLLLLVRGRYAEAGRLFRSALEHTPDDRHDLLAHRHDCLGRYHLTLRAHDLAARHFDKAIRHALVDAEPTSPLVMDLRGNLVLCRFRAGETERALQEVEGLLASSSGDPGRRAALLNLCASIHAARGDEETAEARLGESLRILAAAKGEAHPAVAPILANLGAVRLQSGDAKRALEPLERARAVLERHVSEDHQTLVEILYQIAACRLETGDGAREAVGEARDAASGLMSSLLESGSERELLTFRQQVDLHSIVCRSGDAERIADSLLDGKARIMEAVLERRTRASGPARSAARLRTELDRLLLEGGAGPRIENMREEIQRLEDRRHARPAAAPRWQEVARALPEGTVFVDCVRWFPDGAASGAARYGAVILSGNARPKWIPLGEEREMGRLDLLHRSLRTRADILRTGSGRSGIPMTPLLADLHRAFWQPVAEALPEGTREVIACPEGKMHLLPFAVLRRPDGRFLCEEISSFRIVDSGRRLLEPDEPPAMGERPWMLLGVSRFASHREASRDAPTVGSAALEGLDDLPTVRMEIEKLRAFAPAGSVSLLDDRAGEAALRDMRLAPAVLHFATHGFHVPLAVGRDLAADPSALYENGLLLGRDGTGDGILFPEEAAALDLRETVLVTLSTCRGALGRPVSGEGLLGFRRGFAKAGARNVLASLWEIPDQSTTDFMAKYYASLRTGAAPAGLLWTMQAERFRQLRDDDPAGAAVETAILSYGGFVVSSR